MMGEHLPMVFPGLFDVHDDDLLHPEGELHEVIPFKEASHCSQGKFAPQLGKVEPVI